MKYCYILLLLSLVSCGHKSQNFDYIDVDNTTLYERVIEHCDIESYLLLLRNGNADTIYITSLFLIEQMNYWDAYKYISDEYAFYDAIPMSDTLTLYYEMKYCAYGGFEEEIKNLFAIKPELYDWLRDYTFRWRPSISNKERF